MRIQEQTYVTETAQKPNIKTVAVKLAALQAKKSTLIFGSKCRQAEQNIIQYLEQLLHDIASGNWGSVWLDLYHLGTAMQNLGSSAAWTEGDKNEKHNFMNELKQIGGPLVQGLIGNGTLKNPGAGSIVDELKNGEWNDQVAACKNLASTMQHKMQFQSDNGQNTLISELKALLAAIENRRK